MEGIGGIDDQMGYRYMDMNYIVKHDSFATLYFTYINSMQVISSINYYFQLAEKVNFVHMKIK